VVVQTREGYLDRLKFVNGQPITPEQEKQEDQRIARLLKKSDERKKQQRAQEQDARQAMRAAPMKQLNSFSRDVSSP
jgi:hypothetical protein